MPTAGLPLGALAAHWRAQEPGMEPGSYLPHEAPPGVLSGRSALSDPSSLGKLSIPWCPFLEVQFTQPLGLGMAA